MDHESYVLVSGGLGYIGSHMVVELVSELKEKVIILDNLDNSNPKCLERLQEITGKPENILFFEGDVREASQMEELIFSKFKIKSVIHFAALKAVGESVKKPLEYYENNVSGTVTLLKLMDKYSVNCFVFSSSACVYGDNPSCTEEDRIQPLNPYGQTKAMIE